MENVVHGEVDEWVICLDNMDKVDNESDVDNSMDVRPICDYAELPHVAKEIPVELSGKMFWVLSCCKNF